MHDEVRNTHTAVTFPDDLRVLAPTEDRLDAVGGICRVGGGINSLRAGDGPQGARPQTFAEVVVDVAVIHGDVLE